jgi:hypothetical protein
MEMARKLTGFFSRFPGLKNRTQVTLDSDAFRQARLQVDAEVAEIRRAIRSLPADPKERAEVILGNLRRALAV